MVVELDIREKLWLHHNDETYEKLHDKISEEAKKVMAKILLLDGEKKIVESNQNIHTENEYENRDSKIKEIDDKILELNTELLTLSEDNEEDKLADEILMYLLIKQDELAEAVWSVVKSHTGRVEKVLKK